MMMEATKIDERDQPGNKEEAEDYQSHQVSETTEQLNQNNNNTNTIIISNNNNKMSTMNGGANDNNNEKELNDNNSNDGMIDTIDNNQEEDSDGVDATEAADDIDNGFNHSSTSSHHIKSTGGKVTWQGSVDIFTKYIKRTIDPETNEAILDPSEIFGLDCMTEWLQSRQVKPLKVEVAFFRTLQAHLFGKPRYNKFEPEEEAAILSYARSATSFPCLKNWRRLKWPKDVLGFHEKCELIKTKQNVTLGYVKRKRRYFIIPPRPIKHKTDITTIPEPEDGKSSDKGVIDGEVTKLTSEENTNFEKRTETEKGSMSNGNNATDMSDNIPQVVDDSVNKIETRRRRNYVAYADIERIIDETDLDDIRNFKEPTTKRRRGIRLDEATAGASANGKGNTAYKSNIYDVRKDKAEDTELGNDSEQSSGHGNNMNAMSTTTPANSVSRAIHHQQQVYPMLAQQHPHPHHSTSLVVQSFPFQQSQHPYPPMSYQPVVYAQPPYYPAMYPPVPSHMYQPAPYPYPYYQSVTQQHLQQQQQNQFQQQRW